MALRLVLSAFWGQVPSSVLMMIMEYSGWNIHVDIQWFTVYCCSDFGDERVRLSTRLTPEGGGAYQPTSPRSRTLRAETQRTRRLLLSLTAAYDADNFGFWLSC